MNDFLHTHLQPFAVAKGETAGDLVRRMGGTAFQARKLGQAVGIWDRMLKDDLVIYLGLAGAMVPGGMRPVLAWLIENRLVDVVVSTGANLFHDVYETLGKPHWQGSELMDDLELAKRNINRFYDVLAPEADFSAAEDWLNDFIEGLSEGPYTTREYFALLGEALAPVAKEQGILTAAAKAGVPIYCPAIGDSVHGLAMSTRRVKTGRRVLFDIVRDVLETTHIVCEAKAVGVVYVGGGTPKNFIQQTQFGSYIFDRETSGHKYAIQITMDQPQWGGLSGCTFEEAQSWHKIAADARTVTVNVEATVALPLIASALADGSAGAIRDRKPPKISLEGMPGV